MKREQKEKSLVEERQIRNKEAVIEQLRKTPIIQLAVEKCGIGRASYYRWIHDDEDFAQKVEEAINEGTNLINDMTESMLLSAIKNGNLTAIMFWLRSRHGVYSNKIEVTTKNDSGELTPEQEASIKKALELAKLINKEEVKK